MVKNKRPTDFDQLIETLREEVAWIEAMASRLKKGMLDMNYYSDCEIIPLQTYKMLHDRPIEELHMARSIMRDLATWIQKTIKDIEEGKNKECFTTRVSHVLMAEGFKETFGLCSICFSNTIDCHVPCNCKNNNICSDCLFQSLKLGVWSNKNTCPFCKARIVIQNVKVFKWIQDDHFKRRLVDIFTLTCDDDDDVDVDEMKKKKRQRQV